MCHLVGPNLAGGLPLAILARVPPTQLCVTLGRCLTLSNLNFPPW